MNTNKLNLPVDLPKGAVDKIQAIIDDHEKSKRVIPKSGQVWKNGQAKYTIVKDLSSGNLYFYNEESNVIYREFTAEEHINDNLWDSYTLIKDVE